MTTIESRILALFPPEGSTELSGAQIAKAVRFGFVWGGSFYGALKKLEREGKLTSRWQNMPSPRRRLYRLAGDLPDWDDLRGVAPNATGPLSSEAFVRRMREDDWPTIGEVTRAAEPNAAHDLDDDFASKAILSARRSALIDEAVRRVGIRVSGDYEIDIVGTIYHHDVAQSTFEPFDSCHQCQKTIAAIRSEFAKLWEKRA